MPSIPPPLPSCEETAPVNVTFIAGNTQRHIDNWHKITSCPWTLQTVTGCLIPLIQLPDQPVPPFPFRLSEEEREIMDNEIQKLQIKGIVRQITHTDGEFLSNVFLRPKTNGEFRMILDLTKFNQFVEYKHFKMFSLNTARELLSQNAFMATIDLKDAYYTVPISEEHTKYLRFVWKKVLFEYTCLPNGLGACPRIFTKVLKPVFAKLIEKGHTMFPYIDDVFVRASTESACQEAVTDAVNLLTSLGFTIHVEKSVLKPIQKLKFLGFELDSRTMKVQITKDKIDKFHNFVINLGPVGTKLKIRRVAALLGLMVAYAPAVYYGGAHIKSLERNKNFSLAKAKGNFERYMVISNKGWEDINWWVENISTRPSPLQVPKVDLEITTDASLQGWGAHLDQVATGGRWLHHEATAHINVLELRAVHLALLSLCKKTAVHIHIRADNTTTVAYINKMGGTRSEECNEVARKIWYWAEINDNWLSASYIPGKDNLVADYFSRNFKDHLEWELNPTLFNELTFLWGIPTVDLFASRRNKKCDRYVSWRPEPEAWRYDAFTFKWSNEYFFIFPPFSLLPRVARKLLNDNSHAILVAPEWVAQPWWSLISKEAFAFHRMLRASNNLRHQGPLIKGGDVASTPLRAFLFLGSG